MKTPLLGGRSRLGGIAILTALIMGMLPLFAFGDVTIGDEGGGCIKLDEVGEIVEDDFPIVIDFGGGVVLTITGGTEKDGEEGEGEWMTLDYTVVGLSGSQMISWDIYVGQTVTASGSTSPVTQEGNAAISHVIFCLTGTPSTTTSMEDSTTTVPDSTTTVADSTTTTVADSTTTTVADSTTTTVADSTTTTVADSTTTTVADSTTTTVADSTTTTVADSTTTTVADSTTTTGAEAGDDVLGTVVTTTTISGTNLPLTGARADIMFGMAVVLLGLGLATLTMTRRFEDE